eukprot:CAMPEP_0118645418 /NCGR_PEP_ID=MMETSP0785-20121206/7495_1 /TAXON_ID=91992 /ORGANISM="Bolidomonas pacifica, Strain CCMP 1866" /LENGTH=457 /DNA_ID=CAMNT_0006537309 /DNA_START=54 /DNA_END=1423 /DNA_ORIENTATION=-
MASLFGSDSDTDEDITSTISPSSPSSPSALSNLTQILLSLLSLHNTIHPVDAISNSPVIHPLHKEALEKHAHEVNLDDSLKELYFNSGNNKYKERLGRGDYYVHVAKSSGPPSQHHAKVVTHISSTLGFKVSTDPSLSPDVVVHLSDEDPKQKEEHVKPIKGGTVLVFNPSTSTYSSTLHPPPLSTVNPTVSTFLTQSPSTDSLLTSLSTVSLTLHESLTSPTSITLINCANTILRMGFCVVTSVADKSLISALGTSFKSDLSSALNSVLTRYNVDVTKGEDGGIGFKEVSMREDYRCDIRDGPKVKEMQEEIEALKNNHVVSTIVSLAMNSTSRPPTLRNRHMGNYGRYNFNGGGPSSMYPPQHPFRERYKPPRLCEPGFTRRHPPLNYRPRPPSPLHQRVLQRGRRERGREDEGTDGVRSGEPIFGCMREDDERGGGGKEDYGGHVDEATFGFRR